MKRTWIILAALCLLLGGCRKELPESTTQAPTQVPTQATVPPTEVTVPPTTEAPPEPLALDTDAIPLITVDETLLLTGTADPRYPVSVSGQEILAGEDGRFSCRVPLEVGENTVTISYLEETTAFSVTRRYATAWFSLEGGAAYCPGATVPAEIFARKGSTVEILFNGSTQRVTPSLDQLGFGVPEGFVRYAHRFETPQNNRAARNMGPITYRVTCDGITEEYTTGNILLSGNVDMKRSDPEATPEGYRNVGSGYIVEIVDVNAETFNGQTQDDKSDPTRNYLPKGTMDYGSQGVYYNESANRYYYLLRCGVRVYRRNDNKPYGTVPVVDCYNGYLPDHNELAVAAFRVDGHFTELTLDCLWKAPFFFNQEAQDYYQEDWKRFVLDEYDASYVDITFCYATVFDDIPEIPADHPLFSRAELVEGSADCTLRLHLKSPGAFYGWNAYYNDAGQLCFRFLNPVTVTPADNTYGADLTGLRIMIDVGHGGDDPGANYRDSQKHLWLESERNLALALALKKELESIGAQVIMNRTDEDYTLTRTERIALLMEQQPDFCICVHHNADQAPGMSGFESWYFTPFSLDAARHIQEACNNPDVYLRSNLAWHYYYVARQTACPIVLAENGYMSNKKEMDRIADPEVILQKARDLAQGIANYYLEESGF